MTLPSAVLALRHVRPSKLGPALQDPIPGLLPHQEQGVRMLTGDPYRGRALLCDEMGLGKTVTALQFALEYKGSFIIMCPAGLQAQWRCEMDRFLPVDAVARSTVISYDRMHNADDLVPGDFTVAIADEAHYLKDPQSRRAQACVPFLQRVRRVLLLSGTPVPNRPIELWPLLVALRPHDVPDYETFGRAFAAGYRDRHGFFHARGCTHANVLAEILNARFMLRRTQAQLSLGLPALHVHVQHVDLPSDKRANLAELMEKMEDARDLDRKKALVSAMFAETAKAKRDAAAECMAHMASAAAPLIVFAHHRCMMDALKARAEADGWRVGVIDGRATHAQKHAVARAVQAHGVDVALLSLVAASTGFNLTRAHTVLFAELYWVPATIAQAQARVWRLGQQHAVHVTKLVGRDTCDERVMSCLANKTRVGRGLFFEQ